MSKLAIIIPYYKVEFFEETIKSVAAQSNRDFTLYIGNDASPENPLPVIDPYFSSGEYHYYHYEENVGGKNLTLQWERILENVQEDWFQILGDDDILAENFVNEFYKVLPYAESHTISVMKTVHHHIDDAGHLIRINDYKTSTFNAVDFFQNKYRAKVSSSLSENIFKTAMYRMHRFEKIPLAWGSDDIAILAFSGLGKIFYNRETFVQVRISGHSISGSENLQQQKYDAYNVFRETFLTKYSAHFPVDFVNEVVTKYLQYCYFRKNSAAYSVSAYYLRNFKLFQFAKTIKKIYYVNAHKKSNN
jgi:glycosyltransferase involved in cell wall biosynthesis